MAKKKTEAAELQFNEQTTYEEVQEFAGDKVYQSGDQIFVVSTEGDKPVAPGSTIKRAEDGTLTVEGYVATPDVPAQAQTPAEAIQEDLNPAVDQSLLDTPKPANTPSLNTDSTQQPGFNISTYAESYSSNLSQGELREKRLIRDAVIHGYNLAAGTNVTRPQDLPHTGPVPSEFEPDDKAVNVNN